MNALSKGTKQLEQALERAARSKRGSIIKARVELQQARTAHLKLELKQERRKCQK